MPLWAYTFDEIEKRHIEQLAFNDIPESHRIEYKRDTYPSTEGGSKEFLKDLSAFANHSGGHLVIGIDEKLPPDLRLIGIQAAPDKEIERLESISRSGLEPRLTGVRIRAIPIANNSHALVIRIPKSWNPPHRVIIGNSKRFYIRNSNGAHEMSIDELRAAFTFGNSLSEKIEQFRKERVRLIAQAMTTVPLQGPSRVIIHMIPLTSISTETRISMSAFDDSNSRAQFGPLACSGFNMAINLDGLMATGVADKSGAVSTYTQLYRSGVVEAVVGDVVFTNEHHQSFFNIPEIESLLLGAIRRYGPPLAKLNISPPFAILLSVIGVKGTGYAPPHSYRSESIVDRDELLFPAVILDSIEPASDWKNGIRPIADALWNAWGYTKSRSFDQHKS